MKQIEKFFEDDADYVIDRFHQLSHMQICSDFDYGVFVRGISTADMSYLSRWLLGQANVFQLDVPAHVIIYRREPKSRSQPQFVELVDYFYVGVLWCFRLNNEGLATLFKLKLDTLLAESRQR